MILLVATAEAHWSVTNMKSNSMFEIPICLIFSEPRLKITWQYITQFLKCGNIYFRREQEYISDYVKKYNIATNISKMKYNPSQPDWFYIVKLYQQKNT